MEKHNFIIYKVIISKTKLYGNNNDRVEYSVSCNACNNNGGVKDCTEVLTIAVTELSTIHTVVVVHSTTYHDDFVSESFHGFIPKIKVIPDEFQAYLEQRCSSERRLPSTF